MKPIPKGQPPIAYSAFAWLDAFLAAEEAELQRRHDQYKSAIERAQQRWGM